MKIYIDEAWRWPLAWPMYVGLILPLKKFKKKSFKDSKILTERQRNILFSSIEKLSDDEKCLYSTWIVTNQEIDRFWITASLTLAISRGVKTTLKKYYKHYLQNTQVRCSCDVMDKIVLENLLNTDNLSLEEYKSLIEKAEQFFGKIELIIDGNKDFWLNKLFNINTKTIIKGDQKEPYISMASIIAKVSRDIRMIEEWDYQFPKYWFKKHKGYGTKFHIGMIKKYGPCKLHRNLFLKKINWITEKSFFDKLENIN